MPVKYLTRIFLCFVVFVSADISRCHAQQVLCPNNLDFEQGSYGYWEFYTGSCCPINTNFFSGPLPGRHELQFGPGFDKYGGFPIVAPGGGSYSLKLGNDSAYWQAERARYYIQVPNGTASYTLIYRYAVVFQDPGHIPSEQPKFEVNVYDSSSGQKIACNSHLYVSSSNLPGFQKSTVDPTVYYKDWTTATIDFTGLGGHTIAIDFATADCGKGGHFGYGYLDLSCAMFQVYNINCKPEPTITLTAPPGFQQYQWMDTNFTQNFGFTESIVIPTPTQTQVYAIILTPYPGFGCPDTLYTTVNRSELITEISKDTIICEGSSALLEVKSKSIGVPLTYHWQPNNKLSCNNCQKPTATPDKTTMYYVTVTDTAGCNHTDSVKVTVREAVDPSIESSDTSICQYDQISAFNKSRNPSSAMYSWSVDTAGHILSGQSTPNIVAAWFQPGEKKVILNVTNEGCIESDTINISVKNKPDATISLEPDACINDSVTVEYHEEQAHYKWTISEQDITDSIYTGPFNLAWTNTGNKQVKLFLTGENGCNDSTETDIDVHEKPEAKIVSDDRNMCSGKTFHLQTTEGIRYNYSWGPPQYFLKNNDHAVVGVAEKTGHVHVTVTNEWHCSAHDSFYIYAGPCCDVILPDAFTPNNDGINDTYFPIDIQQHRLIEFMVFNRWGEIVFETKTNGNSWDGTFKGEQLPTGTYHYFIRYICYGDEQYTKKGNFILLR